MEKQAASHTPNSEFKKFWSFLLTSRSKAFRNAKTILIVYTAKVNLKEDQVQRHENKRGSEAIPLSGNETNITYISSTGF